MSALEFKDLLDFCQAEAIANKLSPTEASVYRAICRSYSKMFHTPLKKVIEMDAEHVILNVYEEQLEAVDEEKYEHLEKMLDTIYQIEDPNYERTKSEAFEDDIRMYEREEEERIRLGKPVHPSLAKKDKKTVLENEKDPPENLPKGGSIDLSYLEKLDQED